MKISKTKILIILLLISGIIALRFSPITEYLSFQNFVKYKQEFKDLVNNNYLISVLLYILTYILINIFMLPSAAILTLAGGFIFGIFLGTLYINIGATAGAVIGFLGSRYLFGHWVQETYKDKLIKFNQNLKDNGAYYLFIIRLIPVIPFFLINILAGLTKIRLFTFAWTTALGIIPISLIYTFAGKQIETISKPSDIFSQKIILAFILLVLVSLLPIIFNKIKNKHKK